MQSGRVFKTEQRLSTLAITLRAMWAYPHLVRPPCPECRSSLTIQTEKDSLAFTETLYCPACGCTWDRDLPASRASASASLSQPGSGVRLDEERRTQKGR